MPLAILANVPVRALPMRPNFPPVTSDSAPAAVVSSAAFAADAPATSFEAARASAEAAAVSSPATSASDAAAASADDAENSASDAPAASVLADMVAMPSLALAVSPFRAASASVSPVMTTSPTIVKASPDITALRFEHV